MRRSSKLAPLLVSLALLGGLLVGVLQWQNIFDWWRLRDYTPPARIAQLADTVTMTPVAQRLFYVHYPLLEDKQSFNEHCNKYEQTVVLGCYVQARGIYIYDVQDARLQGVQEVTAAHEMLHAAYDRLSKSEREHIDSLTSQVAANLQNERIKNDIELYRQQDPAVVPNELHSILGTEVRDLPPELETYYARYFSDRGKLVTMSEAYENVFTERKQKVLAYDVQLKTLQDQITVARAQLDTQSQTLQTERTQLDALLAAGDPAASDARIASFNARVRTYSALVASTNAKIDQYNQTIQARNAIADEEKDLIKALDSRLQEGG